MRDGFDGQKVVKEAEVPEIEEAKDKIWTYSWTDISFNGLDYCRDGVTDFWYFSEDLCFLLAQNCKVNWFSIDIKLNFEILHKFGLII